VKKEYRSFFFFSLLVSIATLGGGCATLPNVTETMRDVPADQTPPQIGSAKGSLSPSGGIGLILLDSNHPVSTGANLRCL
jgi:hypothetical protein